MELQSDEPCNKQPPLQVQQTLAMIKPDAVAAGCAQTIMDRIEANGFKILRRRYYRLYPAQAERFYGEHKGKAFFHGLMEFMTSGPIWALELEGVDAIKAWRTLMGPTNTFTATQEAPDSLRAHFGTDGTRNATHGSDSVDSALHEIEFHFPPVESTLAMIKPDAVAAGQAEMIIDQIEQQGFKILQKRSYQLSEEQAKEFYAEHIGKPFFPKLLEFMTSGPIWALALEMQGAIDAWRAMMGPTNSNEAKDTAPMTLRAQFGTDGTMNAVHGSDSRQSAEREIVFHFQALQDTQPSLVKRLPSGKQAPRGATSNVAANEKSQAETAEEEAAAIKIQEAVRDRQANRREQHMQQELVEGNANCNSHDAVHEAAEDRKSVVNQIGSPAPTMEAGKDVNAVEGSAHGDASNGRGEESTAADEGESCVAAAADGAPAQQEGAYSKDVANISTADLRGTLAEPEGYDALPEISTRSQATVGSDSASGHKGMLRSC